MNLKEIYKPIFEELSQVEVELKRQIKVNGDDQKFLKEVSNHFFKVPGKLIRPALVLLSAKSVNPQPSTLNPQLIHLATAVELIHNTSLIHDDVVDEAEIRRGQISLNRKFGNKIAILIGDKLYARAFSLLVDRFDKEILKIFSKTVERMCSGEINELNKPISYEQYLKIIKDKTASFMSVCCQCGAMLNGADEKLVKALADYGLNFGMAYQIIDDYVDGDFLNIKNFKPRKAEEFASNAKRSIRDLKDSIYKEKLYNLVDYILSHSHVKEIQ